MKISFGPGVCADLHAGESREWLETNGLGGYASGTVGGTRTRRYHGLLIAATRPPVSRSLLLAKVEEVLVVGEAAYALSANRYPNTVYPLGYQYLVGFRLDPYPVWTYEAGGVRLEKSVFMLHGENTTCVRYQVVSVEGGAPSDPVRLEIRPLVAFRDHHQLTHENGRLDPRVELKEGCASLQPYAEQPAMHLAHDATEITVAGDWYRRFQLHEEQARGLDFEEDLFSPCRLAFDLGRTGTATVIASTEERDAAHWESYRRQELTRRERLLEAAPSRAPLARALTLAADAFLAARGELTTIVAGYPWFTDWGRDTMIALPGLTLTTGRAEVAKSILLAFAGHVSEGMLPNRFPDAGEEPEYNTVDATLWFFEAIRAWVDHTGDFPFVAEHLYPVLGEILDWHVRGTRFGIRVDSDGLLAAGEAGWQLTWMDAKVGNWVVTPRWGKPVEIQALWYNALRIMERFAGEWGDREREVACAALADRARSAFEELFWNPETRCLYDVVEGRVGEEVRPDASIRPNQILAVSLPYTMLSTARARAVVEAVEEHLRTPYGLRSLARGDRAYRGRCEGDVWSRDGAYHQGTVWGWLIGPFFTAYLRVHAGSPESRAQVRSWLSAFEAHLSEAGLGQVSEIFDGDPPHTPRGCYAQAWSVAELLRVIAELEALAQPIPPVA